MAGIAGNRAASVDVLAIQAASSTKAVIRLVQQSTQSVPSNADTAISFGAGSEEIDTAGWHDVATNTSRITPTGVPPCYIELRGTVWWAADTDDITISAGIGKNGVIVERVQFVLPSTATASTPRSVPVACRLAANGTTDYFELFGKQLQATTGSLSTNIATGMSCTFEAAYIRPQ